MSEMIDHLAEQRRRSVEQVKSMSDSALLGSIANIGDYLRDLEEDSIRPDDLLIVAVSAAKEEAERRGLRFLR